MIEYFTLSEDIRRINNCGDYRDEKQAKGYYQAYNDAEEILKRKHKFDEFQFYDAMRRYFSSSFKESLECDDQLTRIFCLLDRRLGKRKLQDFIIRRDDSEGLKALYNVRCELAGIAQTFDGFEAAER